MIIHVRIVFSPGVKTLTRTHGRQIACHHTISTLPRVEPDLESLISAPLAATSFPALHPLGSIPPHLQNRVSRFRFQSTCMLTLACILRDRHHLQNSWGLSPSCKLKDFVNNPEGLDDVGDPASGEDREEAKLAKRMSFTSGFHNTSVMPMLILVWGKSVFASIFLQLSTTTR